jgi:hypothetical protein
MDELEMHWAINNIQAEWRFIWLAEQWVCRCVAAHLSPASLRWHWNDGKELQLQHPS